MKTRKYLLQSLIALGCTSSFSAWATNGYFMHGYGIKAMGQAGASIAQPQDALAAANNPAGTAWVGNRLDMGTTLFNPGREAKIRGSSVSGANGHYSGNSRKYFLLPEFGFSQQLSRRLGIGIAVYGNGGMNTGYRKNPYGAYGSTGHSGVDLAQIFITPSIAYKFTRHQSFGIGLNLVGQRFAARGLSGFAPFSSNSHSFSNRNHDISFGIGVRLGWQGQLTDKLTFGLTWASRIRMSQLDKYAGLFANNGSFDIPENYGAGLAHRITSALTLSADVQQIRYSHVRAIGNTFNIQSLFAGNTFGSKNGQGFGWRDVTVYKVGTSYAMDSRLTLRGGFSHSGQPVRRNQTFLNILAPGVVQDHLSLGLTWSPRPSSELSLAYIHALESRVKGHQSIPQAFGGGEASVRMKQDMLGAACAWTF